MDNLVRMADKLNELMKDKPVSYEIREVWKDWNEQTKESVVVANPESGGLSWKVFSPKELDEVRKGTFDIKELNGILDIHMKMIY